MTASTTVSSTPAALSQSDSLADPKNIRVLNSQGLHWQVSQATSLYNIRVEMSTDPATNHQGMFMENGSGGFMGRVCPR